MSDRTSVGFLAFTVLLLCLRAGTAAELPHGFVYLRDIAPLIIQDIRYFGSANFVGRQVKGYEAPECILTDKAATALKKAQETLRDKGLGLKVLDCYRPARAVADFVAWSKEGGGDESTKGYYYPTLPKRRLFELGYVASRSGHSSGSTVDVTLAPLFAPSEGLADRRPNGPCFRTSVYLQGTKDMGSDFDCFHPQSHFSAEGISNEARRNRDLLRQAMTAAGFLPLEKEWWHFRLANEPFEGRSFDFPITPRKSGPPSDIR